MLEIFIEEFVLFVLVTSSSSSHVWSDRVPAQRGAGWTRCLFPSFSLPVFGSFRTSRGKNAGFRKLANWQSLEASTERSDRGSGAAEHSPTG